MTGQENSLEQSSFIVSGTDENAIEVKDFSTQERQTPSPRSYLNFIETHFKQAKPDIYKLYLDLYIALPLYSKGLLNVLIQAGRQEETLFSCFRDAYIGLSEELSFEDRINEAICKMRPQRLQELKVSRRIIYHPYLDRYCFRGLLLTTEFTYNETAQALLSLDERQLILISLLVKEAVNASILKTDIIEHTEQETVTFEAILADIYKVITFTDGLPNWYSGTRAAYIALSNDRRKDLRSEGSEKFYEYVHSAAHPGDPWPYDYDYSPLCMTYMALRLRTLGNRTLFLEGCEKSDYRFEKSQIAMKVASFFGKVLESLIYRVRSENYTEQLRSLRTILDPYAQALNDMRTIIPLGSIPSEFYTAGGELTGLVTGTSQLLTDLYLSSFPDFSILIHNQAGQYSEWIPFEEKETTLHGSIKENLQALGADRWDIFNAATGLDMRQIAPLFGKLPEDVFHNLNIEDYDERPEEFVKCLRDRVSTWFLAEHYDIVVRVTYALINACRIMDKNPLSILPGAIYRSVAIPRERTYPTQDSEASEQDGRLRFLTTDCLIVPDVIEGQTSVNETERAKSASKWRHFWQQVSKNCPDRVCLIEIKALGSTQRRVLPVSRPMKKTIEQTNRYLAAINNLYRTVVEQRIQIPYVLLVYIAPLGIRIFKINVNPETNLIETTPRGLCKDFSIVETFV